ncbi:MAG: hypothetical protein A4E36_00037 [Methanoregulaceae archaeon PtaB.Bin009]|nr:MAG: hypothetical protein A4E36_00037 [Methanoregulaceae archaeon PtaB.Bin009]
MMNWPRSISSLWTVSGSTPNFSLIIFRAMTGLTVPPQFTPMRRRLFISIFFRFAYSWRAMTSQPFTVIPIFIPLLRSRIFTAGFAIRSDPQCSDPAVSLSCFGSVTRVGTASYTSWPLFTARTASTILFSSAYLSRLVTAPPHSAFLAISGSLVHA